MPGAVAVVAVVVVVVPVGPPTAAAGEAAGAVEAWTSIIDELSVALLEEAGNAVLVPVVAVVLELTAGWSTSAGLESGAGAGELSCARETDVATSNAAAPQRNWLRRVDIFLWEIDDCGWCLKHEADQPRKKTVKRRKTAPFTGELRDLERAICALVRETPDYTDARENEAARAKGRPDTIRRRARLQFCLICRSAKSACKRPLPQ